MTSRENVEHWSRTACQAPTMCSIISILDTIWYKFKVCRYSKLYDKRIGNDAVMRWWNKTSCAYLVQHSICGSAMQCCGRLLKCGRNPTILLLIGPLLVRPRSNIWYSSNSDKIYNAVKVCKYAKFRGKRFRNRAHTRWWNIAPMCTVSVYVCAR